MAKELAEVKAELKKQAAGKPETEAEQPAGADPFAKEKKRMDEIASEIEHLRHVSGAESLITAKEAEREKLRLLVRTSHPIEVQLRNLDAKIAGVKKKQEAHAARALELSEAISKLDAECQKEAAASDERGKELGTLNLERLGMVQRNGIEKVKAAEIAAGSGGAAATVASSTGNALGVLEATMGGVPGMAALLEQMRVIADAMVAAAAPAPTPAAPTLPAADPAAPVVALVPPATGAAALETAVATPVEPSTTPAPAAAAGSAAPSAANPLEHARACAQRAKERLAAAKPDAEMEEASDEDKEGMAAKKGRTDKQD